MCLTQWRRTQWLLLCTATAGSLQCRPPPNAACVPPPSWYVDPGFLELEKERLFFKTWQYAGPLSKLKQPGDYFTGSLLGRGFVVCMDDDRSIRAFHNICSHRAAAVATGEGHVPVTDAPPTAGVSGLRFECPYHGWQFDLRGRFRGCKVAHGLAGIRDFSPETSSLKPLKVDTWGPLVFLYWGDAEADAPPSVSQFLGDGGARLASELATAAGNPPGQAGNPGSDWVHHKRVEYPMACNWKCMTDNYMDGNYHVFLCHPGLIGCLAMHDNFNLLYDNVAMLCGPSEVPSAWPTEGQPGGKLHHQMVTRTRGGKDQSYSCLYPNSFINRYGQWFSVTNVVPIGPNQCLTTFDLFFKPDTLAKDPEFIAMAEVAEDELQNEDIELCLKVGANLASPMYAAGRYAPIESPMWWHHQRLHKDLFGSAPGLKHRPTDDRMNKALYTP